MEAPLGRFLSPQSTVTVEESVHTVAESQATAGHAAGWLLNGVERILETEIKLLPASPGQRLIMLTLSLSSVPPDLEAAFLQLPGEIFVLDRDLKVAHANGSALMAGRELPGGVLGRSAWQIEPMSVLAREAFVRALAGVPFHDDAVEVPEPGREPRFFDIAIRPLKKESVVTGLVVQIIEVTEERTDARVPQGDRQRLLALTEHARDIMTVADTRGGIQYVSGGVKNLLGYSSRERETGHVFEHIHPEDESDLRQQFEQLVGGKTDGFSKEVRVRHKDGSYRWIESNYVSALQNPLIGAVLINSRDITERKLAEQRLSQREEVFRLAADAVDGVIFEWDVARGVVHRSRGVMEVLGLAAEDMEPTLDAWHERVHPRDFNAMRKTVSLALINGRGWTSTYRIRDARGRYRSMLERGLIQRNAAGDPVRAIGCCVDVSEIRRLTDILDETQRIAEIGGWEYSYVTREMTWTPQMFRIYEAKPKEFDVSWEMMLSQCLPEYEPRLRAAVLHAEHGDGALDLEVEILTLQDKRTWIRIIGHVEMLDGKPFRAFGSVQNVHAERSAQTALENSTRWLKLSMNMAHLHAWRWDRLKDSFEFANLEGKQVHLPALFPNMGALLARMHPDDRDVITRAMQDAYGKQTELHEEFRLRDGDGNYRHYATTARPLYTDRGAPQGFVGVIQDVTETRESARRLRQSEELLYATTTNAADTLFLLDTSLRVCFINKGVAAMSIQQIVGREVDVLLPPGASAWVIEKLRTLLQTGEAVTYEFELRRAGQAQYFENRAVLVQDDGIGTAISISMRDITERKRLEQEILEVSSRERQSIGRDLHDGLGQELTGVALMLRGLATRLKARAPEVLDNINEVVTLVNQSIENARSLARGLLPVRTESGGLVFALRELAERSRDLHGLDVTFRTEGGRELAFDETNASHLYRITQEALTNAARHGHASQVDIVLSFHANGFALRIIDNGQGIKKGPASGGMGLKTMKYRADMIGATFEIRAREPQGVVVTVSGERRVA